MDEDEDEDVTLFTITGTTQGALRKFLQSKAGKDVVAVLHQRSPVANSGNDLNQMALIGAKQIGWKDCIQELLNISEEAVDKQ